MNGPNETFWCTYTRNQSEKETLVEVVGKKNGIHRRGNVDPVPTFTAIMVRPTTVPDRR